MDFAFEDTAFGKLIATLVRVDSIESSKPKDIFLAYMEELRTRWIDNRYPKGVPLESVGEWMDFEKAFNATYFQLKTFEMNAPLDCFFVSVY